MLGSRREARRSRRRQGRRAACQEPGPRSRRSRREARRSSRRQGRRTTCQVISHTTE